MGILEDLRFSLRILRREKGFTAGAILAIALSIGANTSVFAVVKSILLNPLAMRSPDELITIWSARPDGERYVWTIPNFLDLRDRNGALQDIAAYGGWSVNLSGESDPERLFGVRATANYFEMLGVRAVIGRTLERADDQPGRPKVVVITYGLWQRRYGQDPAIVGRGIRLNNDTYTVVGVLPPTFTFMTPNVDVASPLSPETDPWRANRTSTAFLRVFGRLKPGIGIGQAKANLDGIAAWLRSEFPKANSGIVGVDVRSLQEELTAGSRQTLMVLMAAVVFVLLIACANISSLMIAKAKGRQKELAVRSALGGTRWRLARQLLLESALLSVAGGLLGLVLAQGGVRLLLSMSPAELPRAREVHLEPSTLFIALGVSIVCGIFLGLAPAVQTLGRDLNEGLRSDGRGGTAGVSRVRLRAILVVAEVALSLALLTSAGLLMKSFYRLMLTNPGFRADNVTTLRLALPFTRYNTPELVARFHDEVRLRISALPGVASVGAISILPLSGPDGTADFLIDGRPPVSEKEKPTTHYRMIDSTYFAAMDIPILRGRGVQDSDIAGSKSVAVISQALAALYWKDRNPLGAHVSLEDNSAGPRDVEIVGVSGPVHEMSLEQAATPCLFIPIPQAPKDLIRFLTNNLFWSIRTTSAIDMARAARDEIHRVDADVTAFDAPMSRYLRKASATRRFSLQILGAFAISALLLAAAGIYALVSYSTAQRTREIGLRMALGALPGNVAAVILRQGMFLAVVGVAVGVFFSWLLSAAIATMLFDVSPHDPITLAAVVIVLLGIAAAASYIPARRAIRVDPVQALRSE